MKGFSDCRALISGPNDTYDELSPRANHEITSQIVAVFVPRSPLLHMQHEIKINTDGVNAWQQLDTS